jgi:hypothetical protein
MISKLQKPLDSGFNSKTHADEIIKDIDLTGKLQLLQGVILELVLRLQEH